MTTVYDGWYLLDHHRNRNNDPGPAGGADTRPWYTTRRTCHHGIDGPHLLVIHDPETLADFTPPYDEAERVARYGATTTRASWHDSIDADSIIPMLPPEYTAWHVRGFNRCGVGMEVGAMAGTWDEAPEAWLEGVMANTATRAGQHLETFGIPATLLFEPGRRYTSPIDAAGYGIVSHHALDPTRRTDPGFTFPWTDLLDRLEIPTMTHLQARLELATAWHAASGRWMDSSADEDPQERLTRMAEQVRTGERSVADIVRFAPPRQGPTPNEPVPAWVLDRTVPYSALPAPSPGAHSHEATVRLT